MTGPKAPDYQIQCLNNINIENVNSKTTKEIFDRVAFSLKKYGLKWSKIFGENYDGPYAMLKAMRACISKMQYTREYERYELCFSSCSNRMTRSDLI
jgi:hypothetical protein